MKRYEHLEDAMRCELEKLDKKYGGDVAEMSAQDAEKADLLYHALKSAATYHAMKDAEEWEEERGSSYARRRDAMGRYTSRDMGGSGHYPPMMYPRYPSSYDMDWRY